jgi:hypothetical protein
MPKTRKTVVILLAVLAILVIMLAPIYYIRDASQGNLIWSGDQAYVFMTVLHRGYRMNCLRLAAEFVMELFPFGASSPDDKSSSVIVLRIAPGNLQRFDFDDMNLDSPDGIGQDIYVVNRENNEGLLKWSGDHLERASVEEGNALRTAQASGRIPDGPSYQNVGGWSKSGVAGKPGMLTGEEDARVVIQVNGKPTTLVMSSGFITHEAFIDVIRPGETSQRIWHLDERAHRVSRAEYQKTFSSRRAGNITAIDWPPVIRAERKPAVSR